MAGVLLVTADPALVTTVTRLCALAGVQCEVDRHSAAARAAWRSAATILVGADVAAALAGASLPRRERVLVVTTREADVGCWQSAVGVGASRVLRLPADDALLVEELSATSTPSEPASRVVAVLGGCGGAGASTFAVALAITAGRAGSAMLLDGDPLGGGLDVLMGAESVPGVRWNELAGTRGHLDPGAFTAAICDVAGVGVLAWGRSGATAMPPDAVEAVVDASTRAFATVVVDLARTPNPLTELLLDAADSTVVVVPAEVRAVAAAAALMAALGRRVPAPALLVRDPGGTRLSATDVAASLGLPLLTTLRSDPAVQAAAIRGEPPIRRGRCALTEACETVLASATGAAA